MTTGIQKCPGVDGGVGCTTNTGWQSCVKYRQARLCSDDSLTDVWMTEANAATFPDAFKIGSVCYYFDFGDTPSTPPGTLYVPADATAFDSCEECYGPAPCSCPETKCTDYLVRAHVKREYFDKSVADCGGALVNTTNDDLGIGAHSTGACTWFTSYADPLNPDSTTPDADGGFASIDPIVTAPLAQTTTPPCTWDIVVLIAKGSGGGDASLHGSSSTTGSTPATANGAVYPNIIYCEEQATWWVKTTWSAFTVICDD